MKNVRLLLLLSSQLLLYFCCVKRRVRKGGKSPGKHCKLYLLHRSLRVPEMLPLTESLMYINETMSVVAVEQCDHGSFHHYQKLFCSSRPTSPRVLLSSPIGFYSPRGQKKWCAIFVPRMIETCLERSLLSKLYQLMPLVNGPPIGPKEVAMSSHRIKCGRISRLMSSSLTL